MIFANSRNMYFGARPTAYLYFIWARNTFGAKWWN